jgi:acyl dehydratase
MLRLSGKFIILQKKNNERMKFPLKPGDSTTFSKTVSESDVYLFAGLTGDFCKNHVDAEYMKNSLFGERIAHGALLVGFMSTASSQIVQDGMNETELTPVSMGYDKLRFLKPVLFNDTITVTYVIEKVDIENSRSIGDIKVTNQRGELVGVAKHHLKWV